MRLNWDMVDIGRLKESLTQAEGCEIVEADAVFEALAARFSFARKAERSEK
jgi:hypothetical protein